MPSARVAAIHNVAGGTALVHSMLGACANWLPVVFNQYRRNAIKRPGCGSVDDG